MLAVEAGNRRVDEILGFFRCGICTAVPRAVGLYNAPCGHSFCGECATGMREALVRSGASLSMMKCPLCRVTWPDSRPSKAWADMMAATLGSTSCPCVYCREEILRVNKDVHEGECPKKSTPCFHCKVLVSADHRPSHRCEEGLAATLRASARELRETRKINLALTTELMMLRETYRFQAEQDDHGARDYENEDDDEGDTPRVPPVSLPAPPLFVSQFTSV